MVQVCSALHLASGIWHLAVGLYEEALEARPYQTRVVLGKRYQKGCAILVRLITWLVAPLRLSLLLKKRDPAHFG